MKKLKFVLLALFVSSMFISCNKDDDTDNASLVGTWEFVSTRILSSDEDETEAYDHQEGCDKDYITFTANTVYTTYHELDCTVDQESPTNYSLNNNIITVSYGGETGIVYIESLSSSTLVIKEVDELDPDTYYFATLSRK